MKKSLLKLTGFAFLCATTFIGCGSTPKQEVKPDPVKKVEEAKEDEIDKYMGMFSQPEIFDENYEPDCGFIICGY